MNRVQLLGNLAKDPELRKTTNGNSVVNFCIVTSSRYKDQSGAWTDKSEFHNCVCFGAKGEAIAKFFHKGSKICIEGELQTRSWNDKNGQKRYTTEVICRDFHFCERKSDSGRVDSPAGFGEHTQVIDTTVTESDIPF